jgi:prepilin-type N-terminal cleavage/methylation domain-containing protein
MATETSGRGAPRGFSAIELMVVITIGGLLLAAAWIRLSTLVPIYQLEGASRDLAAEFQKARGRAIAEGKCTTVVINVGAKTYQFQRAPSSTCSNFASVPGEGTKNIDPSNSLTVAFASGSNPVFDTRGAVSTTAAITLTNHDNAVRTIFVQSTGLVRVQ